MNYPLAILFALALISPAWAHDMLPAPGVTSLRSPAISTGLKTLLQQAAHHDLNAEVELGQLYENGQGVPQSYREAMKWFLRARDQGSALASEDIGLLYSLGRGVKANPAMAVRYYQEAVKRGDSGAYCDLGDVYYANQQKQSFKAYQQAADAGQACGQDRLGWMYLTGTFVQRDYGASRRYYLKAANQGDSTGQAQMGWFYLWGLGVKQNYSTARHWYWKSVKQGDSDGEVVLAWMYEHIPPHNYALAFSLYRLSAQQGNVVALNNIGYWYEKGRYVHQDYKRAARIFEACMHAGYALSFYHLGTMYYAGEGVPKDRAKGLSMITYAARQGVSKAKRWLASHPTKDPVSCPPKNCV